MKVPTTDSEALQGFLDMSYEPDLATLSEKGRLAFCMLLAAHYGGHKAVLGSVPHAYLAAVESAMKEFAPKGPVN